MLDIRRGIPAYVVTAVTETRNLKIESRLGQF